MEIEGKEAHFVICEEGSEENPIGTEELDGDTIHLIEDNSGGFGAVYIIMAGENGEEEVIDDISKCSKKSIDNHKLAEDKDNSEQLQTIRT